MSHPGGRDSPEVALIEGGDSRAVKALGQDDQGQIGKPKPEVAVRRELGDLLVLVRGQALDAKSSGSKILDEREARVGADALAQQVVDSAVTWAGMISSRRSPRIACRAGMRRWSRRSAIATTGPESIKSIAAGALHQVRFSDVGNRVARAFTHPINEAAGRCHISRSPIRDLRRLRRWCGRLSRPDSSRGAQPRMLSW